ncbi:MAG: RsmD family RNA methyltransferase [Deltaproteobacteria bacterium]|nr:RsmD family RNA methyltransferase [Deltaproteobacteria bacterium]
MIKVTGGTLRGRVLPAPVPEGVRPTSSRAREALFSILGQDLDGLSFVDCFSGSGLVAIEAWSRGARPVTAIDRAPKSLAAMRRNIEAVGAAVEVLATDVSRASLVADVVYLDPPFADDIAAWIALTAPMSRQVLVAESRAGASVPSAAGTLPLDRVYTYGDTQLAVYREAVGRRG